MRAAGRGCGWRSYVVRPGSSLQRPGTIILAAIFYLLGQCAEHVLYGLSKIELDLSELGAFELLFFDFGIDGVLSRLGKSSGQCFELVPDDPGQPEVHVARFGIFEGFDGLEEAGICES